MTKRSSLGREVRPNVPTGVPNTGIPGWASRCLERCQPLTLPIAVAPAGIVGGSGSWFTVRQVAEILQLSERTVRRLIAKGDLPAARIGRSIRLQMPAAECHK